MALTNGYAPSDNVTVFPSVRRIGKAQESKFNTEKSLTRLINMLIDSDGFVITDAQSSLITSNPIEFNIHGYYFSVSPLSTILDSFSSATTIYASILIDKTSEELVGWDADADNVSTYRGVLFTSSVPTNPSSTDYDMYYIILISRSSTTSSWTIPKLSTEKFSGSSIRVDGGIIS